MKHQAVSTIHITMAEGGSDPRLEIPEKDSTQKTVKKKQCRTCGRLVAGHPGRCGRRCKLPKLTEEELQEMQKIEGEMEEEPETEESEEEKDEEEIEEEESERPKPKKKVTSTPKKNASMSALQFMQEKDSEEVLGLILKQLQKMDILHQLY